MLMRWIELTEKRRNPSMNQKNTTLEELKAYQGREDVFVSFVSDVGILSHGVNRVDANDRNRAGVRARGRSHNISGHKIGINPKSVYNTPNGIYCYPIQYVIGLFEKNSEDFATDRPYGYVIENRGKLLVSGNYNYNDLKQDIAKIKEIVDEDFTDKEIEEGRSTSEVETAAGMLWNITRLLSIRMSSRKSRDENRYMNAWSALFRKLGYSGFYDSLGQGIIHDNEPTQCVFFSKEGFNVLEAVVNRTNSKDWMNNPSAIAHLINTGQMELGQAAVKLLIMGNPVSKMKIKYTPELLEKIKEISLKKELPMSSFLFNILLKEGMLPDHDAINIMRINNRLIMKIYEVDTEYLSDNVKKWVIADIMSDGLANPITVNFLHKNGWIDDKATAMLVFSMPQSQVDERLVLPDSVWLEIFKHGQTDLWVSKVPLTAAKILPDEVLAQHAKIIKEYPHGYRYVGPKTMAAMLNLGRQNQIINAIRQGFYDPPPAMWEVIVNNIADPHSLVYTMKYLLDDKPSLAKQLINNIPANILYASISNINVFEDFNHLAVAFTNEKIKEIIAYILRIDDDDSFRTLVMLKQVLRDRGMG